jgi:hypothetical protein
VATVYLAHDVKHDRTVALKVLKPELAAVGMVANVVTDGSRYNATEVDIDPPVIRRAS